MSEAMSAIAAPGISIVIVNYNGGILLERCLRSILENPPLRPFEVIVYDNASRDESRDIVRRIMREARLIEGTDNLGLCRAFNIGAAAARAPLILSLDSDTEVRPGAIEDMALWLDRHPDTGACGSTLVYPDGTPQRTARAFPTPMSGLFGRHSALTRLWPDNPFSRRYMLADLEGSRAPYAVDSLSTACMMTRQSVIERVGAYDESYFVYWSDTDWCRRIKRDGHAIYTLPTSRVVHNENIKAGHRKVSRAKMVIDFHRGAYRYYATHHAGPFNPMRYIAALALGSRAAVKLTVNEIYRLRAARTPGAV